MMQLFELYQTLDNKTFSQKICEIAPYFATIDPLFEELKPNYARVFMPNTPKVHNHLGTVHAIAMCNLAEIVGGIMTDVSIPDRYRWIPVGMNVDYLARAHTDLKGIADGQGIDWTEEGIKEVVVKIQDANDVEVCRATIRVQINRPK